MKDPDHRSNGVTSPIEEGSNSVLKVKNKAKGKKTNRQISEEILKAIIKQYQECMKGTCNLVTNESRTEMLI